MKKWVLCLVVLLLLGYGLTKWKTGTGSQPDESKPGIENGTKPDTPPLRDGFTIDVSKEMIYRGDLLLINKEHPVPAGIDAESEAVSLIRNPQLIDGFGVLDNRVLLSPRLAEKFSTMVSDAAKEGIAGFLISSGFRSEADQEELYRTLGAQIANPPGYSEHNVGLSMDIGSSQAEMSHAPEGKWLIDHSWKYGFVLRFPEDKTAITGVQFEPWHFRYVGLPHSAIMKEKNLVLEEYLDFLKGQSPVNTSVGEDHYQVFYYPVTRDHKIDVPVRGEYEISGNNQDGVIVTVRQSTGQGE